MKTIFLVDDEIVNLKIGKGVLSQKYNVFALESGKRMLELLADVTPDLVLMDIKMPEMDGYEATRRLKQHPVAAHVPVIFLTGMTQENMELEGLSVGAVDYITKPFSAPLLMKRIEVHILMEQQRQELQNLNSNLHLLIQEKTRNVTELKDAILSTMAELVEYRDEQTGGHISRTRFYLEMMLEGMRQHGVYTAELANIDMELALQSCQLHDVGKIAIPDHILLKPGRLTPEEFEQIKQHTLFGEKVILQLKTKTQDSDFAEYARIFAISHHEKWNGEGYPYGLAGTDIPLLGRVMAIADVYDALVSARPYKEPLTHREAVDIIREDAGTHFDPTLVGVFLKIHNAFNREDYQ
jgi:putative two-component system response regulator